jgi:hypothetical protein
MTEGLTFPELARKTLTLASAPMTSTELWTLAEQKGLAAKLLTAGKTPRDSLSALMYVETKENPASEFVRVGLRPVRFWLRSRPLPKGWSETGPGNKVATFPQAEEQKPFLEKDLHPLLAWFARTRLDGVRVKTVHHTLSTKKSFGEWVHPDMIGARFPMSIVDEPTTIEFAGAVRAPLLRLFSFELKRSVDFSNLRESFFQAVSNSSWAHVGYLVAARWLDEQEFSDELRRLSQSFGIGAIHLCLDDLSTSRVLHAARVRDDLDWVTLDKLVAMNPDVEMLLKTLRIDLQASHIHDGEYDRAPEDPDGYASTLLHGGKASKKGKT